jgi:hypothetical protein
MGTRAWRLLAVLACSCGEAAGTADPSLAAGGNASDEPGPAADGAAPASSREDGGTPPVSSVPVDVHRPAPGVLFGPPVGPPAFQDVDQEIPLESSTPDGACPAGTEYSGRFSPVDTPTFACEYVCSPACSTGEVCGPLASGAGNACTCRAAMEASASGCVWPGLIENGTFEDGASWVGWVQGASQVAAVEGHLELRLTRRCSVAWAGALARLPPAELFPEGAALAFDYSVPGDVRAYVKMEGLVAPELLPTSELTRVRGCVSLTDIAWLSGLEFGLEADGLCSDVVDLRLSIDNIRFEAEPGCG